LFTSLTSEETEASKFSMASRKQGRGWKPGVGLQRLYLPSAMELGGEEERTVGQGRVHEGERLSLASAAGDTVCHMPFMKPAREMKHWQQISTSPPAGQGAQYNPRTSSPPTLETRGPSTAQASCCGCGR
jgi:hypothetical protein